MSWENNWNTDNYGGNNYQEQHNEHSQNVEEHFNEQHNENNEQDVSDGLSALLEDDHQENPTAEVERQVEEQAAEVTEAPAAEDTEVSKEPAAEVSQDELYAKLADLTEHFVKPGNNIKAEPIFSERDIFFIHNVARVLEDSGSIVEEWIQKTLGLRGANASSVRRAISIVNMDHSEYLAKTSPIDTLKLIETTVKVPEGVDPLDLAIRTISKVSEMSDTDRSNMINLAKKLLEDSDDAKKITVHKNTSAADVVANLRNVLAEDDELINKVNLLEQVFKTISAAMGK